MGQECSYDYEGPADLKPQVERALRWVRHPLLGVNVLDAGLVCRIQADEQHVQVRLGMTAPCCPLNELLAEDVEAELFDHLAGGFDVDVQLVSRPEWTPARMKVVPIDQHRSCPCRRPDLTAVKACRHPAA